VSETETAYIIVRSGATTWLGTVKGDIEEPDPRKRAVVRIRNTGAAAMNTVRQLITNFIPTAAPGGGVAVVKSMQLAAPDYEVDPLPELITSVDSFYFPRGESIKFIEKALKDAEEMELKERARRSGLELH